MRVIGLISGTSVDGVDAVLVELSGTTYDLSVQFIAGDTYPYPPALRDTILEVCHGKALPVEQLVQLDDAIAQIFADAALQIQLDHLPPNSPAELIGSHGQTVFHRSPTLARDNHPPSLGYSVQLGRGAIIAYLTGIPTVSNFRAADIALGGHGAPLVPAVDAWLLSDSTEHRCMQNIGGIGNVTYLPPLQRGQPGERTILGWDTGPGNALIDAAVQLLSNGQQQYDQDGDWAASGTPHPFLVDQWLSDPFFHQPPPKSTGREKFGSDYARQCLELMKHHQVSDTDALATLTEFTVASIAMNYTTFLPQAPDRVLVGGGGRHNRYLMQRLQAHLPDTPVTPTDDVGISADYKEAIAFAVLAYWRWLDLPGNLPSVTGAAQETPLGEIHLTPALTKDTM